METMRLGGCLDRLPAGFGIGGKGLALDDCDLTVSQGDEVTDGEVGGLLMIEGDAGDTLVRFRARDAHGGKVHLRGESGVDRHKTVHSALGERGKGALDDLEAVVMADEQVEVTSLLQAGFQARKDQSRVAFGDLRNEDTQRHGVAAT